MISAEYSVVISWQANVGWPCFNLIFGKKHQLSKLLKPSGERFISCVYVVCLLRGVDHVVMHFDPLTRRAQRVPSKATKAATSPIKKEQFWGSINNLHKN